MTGRTVPEWIGATPDARPPGRVRMRVFLAHGGICHISKRRIMPGEVWHLDHVQALINGGENRESNMAPALLEPHKQKTAEDVAEKAKVERIRRRHFGVKTERKIRAWRKFDKTPVFAPRER